MRSTECHSNGCCTEVILVVYIAFFIIYCLSVFISFLFIAVHGVINHSVDGVDSIVLFILHAC